MRFFFKVRFLCRENHPEPFPERFHNCKSLNLPRNKKNAKVQIHSSFLFQSTVPVAIHISRIVAACRFDPLQDVISPAKIFVLRRCSLDLNNFAGKHSGRYAFNALQR